jgi:hypothetical protein
MRPRRFNNKTWIAWQVHNSVVADIKVALVSREPEDNQEHTDPQLQHGDAMTNHTRCKQIKVYLSPM